MPTVIIVGGPSGTGKTTTGRIIAKHYSCPFVEGDDLHPPANVEKMASGQPLTDDDRWDWLQEVSETAAKLARDPANKSQLCVASCSMLKKVYREHLEKYGGGAEFRFVFLFADYAEVMKRVDSREGHYMKLNLVKSQYDVSEVPAGDELVKNGGKAVVVDNGNLAPEAVAEHALGQLHL